MNARRYAGFRGLTVRGTRKIWDTSLASMAMLYCKAHSPSAFARFMDASWPQFWSEQNLDIEDPLVMDRLVEQEAGASGDQHPDRIHWKQYRTTHGPNDLQDVVADAEAAGVFGVPSYLLDDGEIFWGREHLPLIRLRLHKRGLARRDSVCPEVPFVWQNGA